MPKAKSAPERAVEFGLTRISSDRTVVLPLRDAFRAYKVFGELIAFFHQPRTLKETRAFLGTRNVGALRTLWDAYYGYLRDVWPEDIVRDLEEGLFDAGPLNLPISPRTLRLPSSDSRRIPAPASRAPSKRRRIRRSR
jgi:hypothetical protein